MVDKMVVDLRSGKSVINIDDADPKQPYRNLAEAVLYYEMRRRNPTFDASRNPRIFEIFRSDDRKRRTKSQTLSKDSMKREFGLVGRNSSRASKAG